MLDPNFDVYAAMGVSRGALKQPRPSASASATSRKNKLQRCSNCGGLGHKSRTCDNAAVKPGGLEVTSACDIGKDARTVLAAYGLLALNGQKPSAALVRQQTQYVEQEQLKLQQEQVQTQRQHLTSIGPVQALKMPSASPPCSPSGRLSQPWREPLSPRVLAT